MLPDLKENSPLQLSVSVCELYRVTKCVRLKKLCASTSQIKLNCSTSNSFVAPVYIHFNQCLQSR